MVKQIALSGIQRGIRRKGSSNHIVDIGITLQLAIQNKSTLSRIIVALDAPVQAERAANLLPIGQRRSDVGQPYTSESVPIGAQPKEVDQTIIISPRAVAKQRDG